MNRTHKNFSAEILQKLCSRPDVSRTCIKCCSLVQAHFRVVRVELRCPEVPLSDVFCHRAQGCCLQFR